MPTPTAPGILGLCVNNASYLRQIKQMIVWLSGLTSTILFIQQVLRSHRQWATASIVSSYVHVWVFSEVWSSIGSGYFVTLGLDDSEASRLHLQYYTQYGLALRGLTRHHEVGKVISSLFPSIPTSSRLTQPYNRSFRFWSQVWRFSASRRHDPTQSNGSQTLSGHR
jgi:hypothetical protein